MFGIEIIDAGLLPAMFVALLGGIISLLTGLGVDTIIFALIVLRFRVKEHVAQVLL